MPVIRQEQQVEQEKLVQDNPEQTQQEHDEYEAPDISDSVILQGSDDEETTSVCSEDNNPQENILLTPTSIQTSFNTFNINIHVNIYPFPVASSVEPQMNSTPNTAKSWRLRLGGKSASSLANSKIRSIFPELN